MISLLLTAIRLFTAMLVLGGYLITVEQLIAIGKRRGLDIESASHCYMLNKSLESKGIYSVYAIPVFHPRGMPNEPGQDWIVITSESKHIDVIHPMYVEPFEDPGEESKVYRWLKFNGIEDAKWATVVDPYFDFAFNENGELAGNPDHD